MKYYTLNHVLTDSNGKIIKELSCPLSKKWDQLLPFIEPEGSPKSEDQLECSTPKKYCDGCQSPVYDVKDLNEKDIIDLVNLDDSPEPGGEPPQALTHRDQPYPKAPCLHLNFQRPDLELIDDVNYDTETYRTIDKDDQKARDNIRKSLGKKSVDKRTCERGSQKDKLRIIRTARNIGLMKWAVNNGFSLQLESVPTPEGQDREPRQWIVCDKDKKISLFDAPPEIEVMEPVFPTVKVRGERKMEKVKRINPDAIPCPVAAYLIPNDIRIFERVYVVDVIKDIDEIQVDIHGKETGRTRLKECEAEWNIDLGLQIRYWDPTEMIG